MMDDAYYTRYTDGCPCADCGRHTDIRGASESFMVHDHICAAARMPEQGFLCIGCLETRLGRQLCAANFIDYPINDPRNLNHTQRPRDRLGRE
jgi:hypothetical protein